MGAQTQRVGSAKLVTVCKTCFTSSSCCLQRGIGQGSRFQDVGELSLMRH